MGAMLGAKTSRYFLFGFGHPHIPFDEVVVKRNTQVIDKGRRLMLVIH